MFLKYSINYTKLYKKSNLLSIFVISNGVSCHGASCLWGELSVGRLSWGELSMGRVVHGASCPWGRVVLGVSCLWGKMTVVRVVMGRVVREPLDEWSRLVTPKKAFRQWSKFTDIQILRHSGEGVGKAFGP
jgi:hypothetical protein